MRYSGLENDITYIEYNDVRNKIIDLLNDDDRDINVQYVVILIYLLKEKREVLDKIKEYKDGRTEI